MNWLGAPDEREPLPFRALRSYGAMGHRPRQHMAISNNPGDGWASWTPRARLDTAPPRKRDAYADFFDRHEHIRHRLKAERFRNSYAP